MPCTHVLAQVYHYNQLIVHSTPAMTRRCRLSKLPPWFGRIFGALIIGSLSYQEPRLDALELFSGIASITSAFTEKNYIAEGWDNASDPRCDVLSLSGVKLLIQKISQIKPGGLLWLESY